MHADSEQQRSALYNAGGSAGLQACSSDSRCIETVSTAAVSTLAECIQQEAFHHPGREMLTGTAVVAAAAAAAVAAAVAG
jgi:hypothetical protein